MHKLYGDVDTDAHPDRYVFFDVPAHGDTDLDPDERANRHANGHVDARAPHGDTDSDVDADLYADADRDTYAAANRHTHHHRLAAGRGRLR